MNYIIQAKTKYIEAFASVKDLDKGKTKEIEEGPNRTVILYHIEEEEFLAYTVYPRKLSVSLSIFYLEELMDVKLIPLEDVDKLTKKYLEKEIELIYSEEDILEMIEWGVIPKLLQIEETW